MNDIERLRSMIPEMSCKPGCSDCCGPVPFSKWEWDQVQDKREAAGIKCPYVGPSGCECYPHRPIICRLFGTFHRLACPHGCKPPSGYLPGWKADFIGNDYVNIMKGDPS